MIHTSEGLDMSEEYPGGYSREFLEALSGLAKTNLGGYSLMRAGQIGRAQANSVRRLRGIIREVTALLEANLLDDEMVEEASNELALWLEQDPMLENEAHRIVRENLK